MKTFSWQLGKERNGVAGECSMMLRFNGYQVIITYDRSINCLLPKVDCMCIPICNTWYSLELIRWIAFFMGFLATFYGNWAAAVQQRRAKLSRRAADNVTKSRRKTVVKKPFQSSIWTEHWLSWHKYWKLLIFKSFSSLLFIFVTVKLTSFLAHKVFPFCFQNDNNFLSSRYTIFQTICCLDAETKTERDDIEWIEWIFRDDSTYRAGWLNPIDIILFVWQTEWHF